MVERVGRENRTRGLGAPGAHEASEPENLAVMRFQRNIDQLDGVRIACIAAAGQLSGGNQQKIVLARWLALRPKILIVDEPTRGIDIGSKVEVHNLLIDMAKQGIAVIVISSELPEILAVSDRIVTMREGRVTGEIARDQATQEILMAMMTAHGNGAAASAA